MSKLRQIFPDVVEERRKPAIKTESGLPPSLPTAPASESLPPFATADPDELHHLHLTVDDVSPVRLPALPESDDPEPEKKKARLAIAGMELMADEHFPAILNSFSIDQHDLRNAQIALDIPDRIPFAQIPEVFRKFGQTAPLTLAQVMSLYTGGQNQSSPPAPFASMPALMPAVIKAAEMNQPVSIEEIPEKLETIRAGLLSAGQSLPDTFPVDIPALMNHLPAMSDYFSMLPAYRGSEQEPIAVLEFIISAVQTCRTRHYIEERPATVFCNALACTQHYYHWLATLQKEPNMEFIKMKRQIVKPDGTRSRKA